MRYFDTCALVKQYLQEAGSKTVRELLKPVRRFSLPASGQENSGCFMSSAMWEIKKVTVGLLQPLHEFCQGLIQAL